MINDEQAEFMAAASAEAERGFDLGDGLPFGAVIAKNGRLLVAAHNESAKRQDPNAHSELLALKAARRMIGPRLRGCVLYSTCKPCDMCLQACLISQIDAIVYEDARVSPSMGGVKKTYKKLILKRISTGGTIEMEKRASWSKSFLRQVDEDERSMLTVVSSSPVRRNLSGGSAGSMF